MHVCLALTTIIIDWMGIIFDVKGAFLTATLAKPLYMEIPEGWEDKFDPDEVLLLKKAAYGCGCWKKVLAVHLEYYG